MGVERIVIACEFDASLADAKLKGDICAETVAAVRSRSSYPVAKISELKDRDPVAELVLKVSASRPTPDTVQLQVRPQRFGFMTKTPPSLMSSIEGSVRDSAALKRLVSESLRKIFP